MSTVVFAEQKNTSRYQCLKHPDDGGAAARRVYESHRQIVADQAQFMTLVMNMGRAPRTEVVKKGQKHHRFCFGEPLIIKPLDGREPIVAQTTKEAEKITKSLRGVGYQVQEYLQGYRFHKVKIVSGVIEGPWPDFVFGATRRVCNFLYTSGVRNFTLTVATNGITTYIIGSSLD